MGWEFNDPKHPVKLLEGWKRIQSVISMKHLPRLREDIDRITSLLEAEVHAAELSAKKVKPKPE